MAQHKSPRKLGANLERNIRQSQSLLNVSELETRAKATVKDIEELYTALQGLVPKKSHHHEGVGTGERKSRSGPSGTDTDTDGPQLSKFRRCQSEKYLRKQQRDPNMNFLPAKPSQKKPVWEKTVPEKPVLQRTLSDERHIASDTEVELKGITGPPRVQRQLSLPAYEEDETRGETDGGHKRSKFFNFRRHRQAKPRKKSSSWRSFFSTLSLKRRKSKKNGKNKIGYNTNTKTGQIGGNRAPKVLAKSGSAPTQERTPKSTPPQSFSVGEKTGNNPAIRKSVSKRQAPEPPTARGNTATNFQIQTPNVETPYTEPRPRCDALETKYDQVQKKISAWYKHAVRETNSLAPKETLRATRSHENLLTDSEIFRKRGTFSSDTDSFSGGDRSRVNNAPKTRVRKTRARRNRRRERARYYSCPNVRLVTKALDEAEKKANTPQFTTNLNVTVKHSDCTDNASEVGHVTTVKPVEAKLSFGSSLDNDEPTTDFTKLQNAYPKNWLTRQCSKTKIGCIRPLQLNLFYSESPSRETVFRSRSTIRRPKIDGKESGAGNPQEFAFKIRRSSSRRRKRRSFKRGQTRLPHQSPFYVPPRSLNGTPKHQPEEDSSARSKDSGLGSPDVNDDKRFATFPVMKRDQRLPKLHSESEDSGWASSHRHCANTSDTGIQTDPVIVMTAASKVRSVLPHATNEESEA